MDKKTMKNIDKSVDTNMDNNVDTKIKKDKFKRIYDSSIDNSIIRLVNVKKSYKKNQVLKGVSLTIKQGDRVALLGRNGSGKTTLVDIISHTQDASEGQIYYAAPNNFVSLSQMAVQYQTLISPELYTTGEIFDLFTKARKKGQRVTDQKVEDIKKLFNLESIWKSRVVSLSGGQQQRLNIALAILKEPKILILDELSTGLDTYVYRECTEYILKWAKANNVTIVLISHNPKEIQKLTTKYFLLKEGQVAGSGFTRHMGKEELLKLISYDPTPLTDKQRDKGKNKVFERPRRVSNYISELLQKRGTVREQTKNTIELKNVTKTFNLVNNVLNDINITIKKGEKVGIVGPNGGGKTTLAEIIATTQQHTLGTISYWWSTTNKGISAKVGMQFQDSLFPEGISLKEVLLFFAKASHMSWDSQRLYDAVESFSLGHVMDFNVSNLSAGERQRVNILISLLKKPELLILDEISTGLDIQSIELIMSFLETYFKKNTITLIFISHNIEEIARLTKRVLVMDNGTIIQDSKLDKSKITNEIKTYEKLIIDIQRGREKKG